MEASIIESSEDHVSVCLGICGWRTAGGFLWLEEDYRVGGRSLAGSPE
jgi:hypothetical protein